MCKNGIVDVTLIRYQSRLYQCTEEYEHLNNNNMSNRKMQYISLHILSLSLSLSLSLFI